MREGWSTLLQEFRRETPALVQPIPAYSEFMPSPLVGIKPYGDGDPFTRPEGDDLGWNVSEFEEGEELKPGLEKIARHLADALDRFGEKRERGAIGRALKDNPPWADELAAATAAGSATMTLAIPLALSRTQDDKGRVRWTLFGASHLGPARGFWRSFDPAATPLPEAAFRRFASWAARIPEAGLGDLKAGGIRVLPMENDPDFPEWDETLPEFASRLVLAENASLESVRAIVTFRPWGKLPEAVRAKHLAGTLPIIPAPASLAFWGHPGYRQLAKQLPRAMQIPFLQLFPRGENKEGIRIPQSGWLDESADRGSDEHFRRTHRWQRVERDDDDTADPKLDDPVTVALFSSRPDDLGLYGKPMARNVQIWSSKFESLLDGPRATREMLGDGVNVFRGGGRFGYRFQYPPMKAGTREVYWHRPLLARRETDGTISAYGGGPYGFLTAERDGESPIELWPRIQEREAQQSAVELFTKDPGRLRGTTTSNVRKLLEWRELLGSPLPATFARRLVNTSEESTLEAWLASLASRATDPVRAGLLAGTLATLIGVDHPDDRDALTFEKTGTREFEERWWRAMAQLAEGDLRAKNVADVCESNEGRTGGALGSGAAFAHEERQLERVGEYLHGYYRELIKKHGMSGKAFSGDHVFRWETDFDFSWSAAWRRNRDAHAERNIFMVIPGRNRGEAILMGDHYDTAYMEDLYEPVRGGDRFRAAAAGADDNASATAALQLAANILLPMSRDGLLERDVWLVHLTGEEFPADCLGARALTERLLKKDLSLRTLDGSTVDLSKTEIKGAFVLDMVGHNNDRHRDVFQIAPGEGRAAARLAWRTHQATERWNRATKTWNLAPERKGRGRRVESGATIPPICNHLALTGEVRPEWDPRSALYNTDAQIFSDSGIPSVLLMENYDIRRAGYHDTHDTMKNIDLDYGAALVAIAIEAVADAASAKDL